MCHTTDRIIKGEFRSGRMIRIISEESLYKDNVDVMESKEKFELINKMTVGNEENGKLISIKNIQ